MPTPAPRGNKGFYILTIAVILITALLGIGLSLFTYWGFTKLDEDKINTDFLRAVDQRLNAIQSDLNAVGTELHAVASLYEVNPATTRKEFASFVTPIIERNKSVQAIIWIPTVKAAEREALEKKAREEGLPSFQFIEKTVMSDPSLKQQLVRAQGREFYFPAYYIEPAKENEDITGFDFASDQTLLDTVNKARDSHDFALSPRINFFHNKGDSYSVALMLPVFVSRIVEGHEGTQELLGVVAAIVSITDLVGNAMKRVEPAFINLYIYDDQTPKERSFLSFYDMEPWLHRTGPESLEGIPATYWSSRRKINFGQRKWTLAFHADEFGYEKEVPWIEEHALDLILGASVIISLGLGLAIWSLIRRIKERDLRNALEDSVQQRTQELASTIGELKMTQAKLVAQEKLASLGSLTAGIAHEMKNPLNFINNFSDLSLGLLPDISTQIEKNKAVLPPADVESINETFKLLKENLTSINEQGKKANQVILTMLDHAKKTTGQFALSDIHYILEQSIEKAYKTSQENNPGVNVVLDKEFDVSVGKLDLVGEDIERAFLNILNNAFYAVAEKKKTAGEGYNPRIVVKTEKVNDKLKVTIRDNGTGIPVESKPKVFTPFFTTKPSGKGAGLGLSLSHDIIVDEHSGSLTFDTVPGDYTEFDIVLPITQKKQKEVIE